MSRPLLSVEKLVVDRGGRDVVRNVSLTIDVGEAVLIIGHNGSGKSTLLMAIAGVLPIREGSIRWEPASNRKTHSILLQDSSTFPSRSVIENVAAGATGRFKLAGARRAALERTVTTRFPELAGKFRAPANSLSGGQKRLVGVARTALTNASVFLLDEPTLGLAENVAARTLHDLVQRLAPERRAALLVEHNVPAAAVVATRLCVMKDGELVYDGDVDLLQDSGRLRSVYL